MRRRTVLGSLLGTGSTLGLAGCLSVLDGDDDTGSGDDGQQEASPARETAHTVTIEEFEPSLNLTIGSLGFDVQVTEPDLSTESPATIRVEVVNETQSEVTLETGHRYVFSTIRDEDEQFFLLDRDRDVSDEAPDVECPMLIDRPEAPDETVTLDLPAGQQFREHYLLWVDFDGLDGRCPEPGTATFRETMLVEQEGTTDADQWGFTIGLE